MIGDKKVIALCIVHYGCEYLTTAIKAVYPLADEIVIAYTPTPSHGTGTDVPCPETRAEIYDAATINDLDFKVFFTDVIAGTEGEQRGKAERICEERGASIIVRFDADEVWNTESLKEALKIVSESDEKYFKVGGFVNFWKSFNLACYDSFEPIRIINVLSRKTQEISVPGTIYHFSCAQSDKVMNYKYLIHGHHDESRPNWLQEKYYNWQPGMKDLHMVSIDLWNATPFDKNTLPDILKEHKNFNKEVIC